jgi:hypothetical protein
VVENCLLMLMLIGILPIMFVANVKKSMVVDKYGMG